MEFLLLASTPYLIELFVSASPTTAENASSNPFDLLPTATTLSDGESQYMAKESKPFSQFSSQVVWLVLAPMQPFKAQ
jgi:hypothetical protein